LKIRSCIPSFQGKLELLIVRGGRRYGFEFKYADAPKTTRSMRVALADLGLEMLFVVYPGQRKFELDNQITALPLTELGALQL
jgi:hypothetical protein